MGALKALKRKFRKLKLRMVPLSMEPDVMTMKPTTKPRLSLKKRVMQTVPVNVVPTTGKDVAASSAVASPLPSSPKVEKHQPIRDANGRAIIWVDMQGGNRIVVKWDKNLEGFTKNLTWNEEVPMSVFGRIEELKAQGAMKKIIPCNLSYIERLFAILNGSAVRDFNNKRIYDVRLSESFEEWYDAEHAANQVCEDASKFLIYDEETVQRDFPFLKKRLYPWQGPGCQFINEVTRQGRGAFLCDETGLGKTYIVGAHLASMGYKAVVVCPAGLRLAWKRKLEEATNLSCFVVESNYPHNAHKYDVIIVSYAMLKKRGMWPLSEWVEAQGRVLILDEGQAAKNYDSTRTARCLSLSHYARHTVVVTATPLKNRVEELHPLLRMTRRLWTEVSFEAFIKMYRKPEAQEEIAEHLQKFMVRRMADEVWKNAPKLEVGEAWLALSNRQDYMEAEADLIEWLRRNGADEDRLDAAARGHALVKLNKLRQLAAEGKVEAAAKIINQTMKHDEQVVVFCAFNEPLEVLARMFSAKTGKNFKGQTWHGSALLIGSTPEATRQAIIARFMAGEIGLLCVGSNAGGVGIDLPIARFGYTLDLPWSPADFEQCTGRLKRIGQERDCQFIKFLAGNTIDQRMEEIIQEKANTFKRAVGDEGIVERVTGRDPGALQDTVVTALLRSYLRDAG